MPSGRPPTWTPFLVTVPVAGSIRSTVSSPSLATHTPLGPLAMATGTLPTGIVCTTVLAAALIRDTVPSPLLVTHTSSPVTVTAARCGADRDLLHHGMGRRVDPGQRAFGAVHGPDRAVAVGQAGRAAHAHRGADPSPSRVDQAHAVGRQARLARPPTAGPRRQCTRPRRPRAPSRWPAGGGRAAAPSPAHGCPRAGLRTRRSR